MSSSNRVVIGGATGIITSCKPKELRKAGFFAGLEISATPLALIIFF